MRRTLVVSAAVLALALTGCGGGKSGDKGDAPQVAALPSTQSSTPAADTGDSDAAGSSGDDQARPQFRLDDTGERRDALIRAWDACLIKNGAEYATGSKRPAAAPADSSGKAFPILAEPIPAKAKTACQDKLPLMPPELEPGLNPHYREDWQADVACLRKKGYKVHLTTDDSAGPGGLTWTYDGDNGELPDNAEQIESACQLAAFGHKK